MTCPLEFIVPSMTMVGTQKIGTEDNTPNNSYFMKRGKLKTCLEGRHDPMYSAFDTGRSSETAKAHRG
eukprot:TRINITY_DN2288_c0_g1_i1.p2 TRINITY_DN2288_c0_g1~~TRINITY_DN2288_c0_g1_i1.p2  ORF type:complete len:68 (+),score=17.41 TRINITY_DN2288_c0_g1_i1:358-561(+)